MTLDGRPGRYTYDTWPIAWPTTGQPLITRTRVRPLITRTCTRVTHVRRGQSLASDVPQPRVGHDV
eukprot:1944548-Prymnesium_polylepis.1